MTRGSQVVSKYEALGRVCSVNSLIPTVVPAGAPTHPSHIRKISLSGVYFGSLKIKLRTKIAKNHV